MNRDIKFRGWFQGINGQEYWAYGYLLKSTIGNWEITDGMNTWTVDNIGQFTGFLDKNGVEIYEGDIFRVEEVDEEICDQCDGCGWHEGGESLKINCEHCNGTGSFIGDNIYYLVIIWVKEWGMFCTLTAENEYFDYINEGIKALDEPMFWTYTLEDTDSKKFFLCGNIYQNPNLL